MVTTLDHRWYCESDSQWRVARGSAPFMHFYCRASRGGRKVYCIVSVLLDRFLRVLRTWWNITVFRGVWAVLVFAIIVAAQSYWRLPGQSFLSMAPPGVSPTTYWAMCLINGVLIASILTYCIVRYQREGFSWREGVLATCIDLAVMECIAYWVWSIVSPYC